MQKILVVLLVLGFPVFAELTENLSELKPPYRLDRCLRQEEYWRMVVSSTRLMGRGVPPGRSAFFQVDTKKRQVAAPNAEFPFPGSKHDGLFTTCFEKHGGKVPNDNEAFNAMLDKIMGCLADANCADPTRKAEAKNADDQEMLKQVAALGAGNEKSRDKAQDALEAMCTQRKKAGKLEDFMALMHQTRHESMAKREVAEIESRLDRAIHACARIDAGDPAPKLRPQFFK